MILALFSLYHDSYKMMFWLSASLIFSSQHLTFYNKQTHLFVIYRGLWNIFLIWLIIYCCNCFGAKIVPYLANLLSWLLCPCNMPHFILTLPYVMLIFSFAPALESTIYFIRERYLTSRPGTLRIVIVILFLGLRGLSQEVGGCVYVHAHACSYA